MYGQVVEYKERSPLSVGGVVGRGSADSLQGERPEEEAMVDATSGRGRGHVNATAGMKRFFNAMSRRNSEDDGSCVSVLPTGTLTVTKRIDDAQELQTEEFGFGDRGNEVPPASRWPRGTGV